MEKEPKLGGLEHLVEGQETESIISEKEQELRILEKKKYVLELLDKAVIMKMTRDANPNDEEKEQEHVEAKKAYEKEADEYRELESSLPEYKRFKLSQLESLDDVYRKINELNQETQPVENNAEEIKENNPETKKEAA